MKTKAAVMYEPNKPLQIEEFDLEGPQQGEVLVKYSASGICHSDYSILTGVMDLGPSPMILGHEGAGIIEEVGPGVTELAPGDHVVAVLTPSCGKCVMCQEEKPFMCSQMARLMGTGKMLDGTTRFSRNGEPVYHMAALGTFSERSVVQAGSVVKVKHDAPLDTVCLVGCGVTTGVGAAVNTAKVHAGSSVAVIGCGGVGLSIIQGARINGASTIIAVDPVPEKRELAMQLGATHGVDPFAEGGPIKQVKALTGGLGVHYAFEALGRIDTTEQTWSMIRPAGRAIIVGMTDQSEKIKLKVTGLLSEKRIKGSGYGSAVPKRDVPRFVDWYLSGELKLDEMITKRIKLEDINQAFDEMARGEGARSVIMYD
ncbi:MAG: S-(hydroxymethyl)glutathione dehydrogenase [Gammaproteobacteria bacterium]|nr:MAG: S-(hydroxymethyl)glutathione dehydrogenase [Gammaproteobacteria bacterium]RLA56675.1 MAG: S-(hydroxymethyl)glutathione dehydrogenase [Gammaproteobacteria bacterium]HDY83154.1 Zn-dependent alcohol dehydrogenase [Halieaceae bacterium]